MSAAIKSKTIGVCRSIAALVVEPEAGMIIASDHAKAEIVEDWSVSADKGTTGIALKPCCVV